MFANFLYFIIALIIFTTYQAPEEPYFNGLQAFVLFIFLLFMFVNSTRGLFKKIEQDLDGEARSLRSRGFDSALTRQSILAVFLFAINIYGLNLPLLLEPLPLFSHIPTLQAVVFLGLFVCYLSIVWAYAHESYARISSMDLSRREYIKSNISFSIPVLLPWFLLSGVADVIEVLPFDLPKRFLSTPGGEVSYFLFFLFAIAIFAPAIIKIMWRCKPLEAGWVRSRIEDLCARAGMPYANILYWPIFGGGMITAGVMGLVKRFRYILVTRGLLNLLEPEEIDAVIAHEIGHVKKNHLLYYLFFLTGFLLFSRTAVALLDAIISDTMLSRLLIDSASNPFYAVSIMANLFFIAAFFIYFRFIFGYFMRNFERQADGYVYALFDSALPLISTLDKIAALSGQPADKPNWHHYSIQERIDFLKQCEADRSSIPRHDRKIRKSLSIYVVSLLLIVWVGNHFSPPDARDPHALAEYILAKIEKHPENPELHGALGDVYYTMNNFEGVRDAYEESLALDAGNPIILNNLAWLYATCEDESLRDAPRALFLAKKAADLK
ncbi:MAG: M48 family metalloprotease, partial [Desulfobacterales bacterium]|nr:M48 family metalloprotease [Desulfobacterales bacterium]